MLPHAIDFKDYAASRITKTLLSIFFTRDSIVGAQFSYDHIISNAYHLSQKLEESKTHDGLVNYFALDVIEGMLFGFYENQPENKDWTGLVHRRKIPLFVKDAYRIAEMMATQSKRLREAESQANAAHNSGANQSA